MTCEPNISMSCACFGPRHLPYSNYLYRESDIATVGTICVGPRFELITFPTTSGCVTCYATVAGSTLDNYSMKTCYA